MLFFLTRFDFGRPESLLLAGPDIPNTAKPISAIPISVIPISDIPIALFESILGDNLLQFWVVKVAWGLFVRGRIVIPTKMLCAPNFRTRELAVCLSAYFTMLHSE